MEAGNEQLSISDLIINNEKFIISGKDFKLLIKFLGSEQPSPAQQAIIHFKKTFNNLKILVFLAFWRDVNLFTFLKLQYYSIDPYQNQIMM